MDLVIAQDLFLNETAREFAHAFLPACSSFERGGTFMNAERRLQRVRKAIEPLGNSKPDWEIVQRVARAMGHQQGFDFDSEEEIWEEVRSVWAPGAGMSYQRLEEGGLQWPCPSEDHPGMQILHASRFPVGERAAVRTVPFEPSPESPTDEFPFVLNSGRSLYQFNAGTMTMRTANRTIRPTDTLDMNPADAEGLGLKDGDRVRLVSCYGEAGLPIRRDRAVRHGELFATFHDRGVFLNLVTGGVRDRVTHTPEYKRTAVRVERVEGATR
jgi:formate dehydrogenase major subunit